MTIAIVGGLSSTHDELLAAALRGRGVDARALVRPDAAALALGRSLLPRGYPNPTYYLAGALVDQLRQAAARDRLAPDEVARCYAHVTVAGRFGQYASDYRLALAAAGLSGLPVVAIDPLGRSPSPTMKVARTCPSEQASLAGMGIALDARLVRQLMRAVVAGDVLVRASSERRPYAREPATVDADVMAAHAAVASALERGAPLAPALGRLRRTPARARQRRARLLRVRLTGDPFSCSTDGDGGQHVVRWLEAHGAIVQPPPVAEWLLYLAWQARGRRRADPRSHLGRAEVAVHDAHRRYATAAGLDDPTLLDMDDLATLAAAFYPTHLAGGTGHLEIGTFLAMDRDDRADLVVSVKPFASSTSSSISDAVIHALERTARRTVFLSVEATGDAEAQVESRLELARDLASAHAAGRTRPRRRALAFRRST